MPHARRKKLRELISHSTVQMPGAFNALVARAIEKAGFEAVYVSGAGLSNAVFGLPDVGLVTMTEAVAHAKRICQAVTIPVVVDGDTGFGEAINAARTVTEMEAAGVSGIHFEDQVLPKKCGHLNDKRLIPPEDAAAKIAAAVKGRSHLRIIARTDAAAVEGLEGAIARANLYKEAGADVVFPDALPSEEDFRAFADAVPGPKMANMTEFGLTPYFTARQFQDMGYDIVIWPATSMRVAAGAMAELYAHIRDHGGAEALIEKMPTRAELYETIGYYDYEALDEGIAKSVVPEAPGE